MFVINFRGSFPCYLKKFVMTICLSGSLCQEILSSDLPSQCIPTSQSVSNTIELSVSNYDRSLADQGFWQFLHESDNAENVGRLTRLADATGQRENWYEVSKFISEFFCFSSNLAILGVGIHDQSWYTVFAGLMSGISHAVPTQIAHDGDILGVAIIAMVVAYNYAVILDSPPVLIYGFIALTMHAIDTYLSRTYGDIVGPWPHVVWHLTAAMALHQSGTSGKAGGLNLSRPRRPTCILV